MASTKIFQPQFSSTDGVKLESFQKAARPFVMRTLSGVITTPSPLTGVITRRTFTTTSPLFLKLKLFRTQLLNAFYGCMKTAIQSTISTSSGIHLGEHEWASEAFDPNLTPFRGQMVGKIGRQIKNLSNGTLLIPRIYALDPAGKLFHR